MKLFKQLTLPLRNWWYYGLNEYNREVLKKCFWDFFYTVGVVLMLAFIFIFPYLVHLSSPYVEEFFTTISISIINLFK